MVCIGPLGSADTPRADPKTVLPAEPGATPCPVDATELGAPGGAPPTCDAEVGCVPKTLE